MATMRVDIEGLDAVVRELERRKLDVQKHLEAICHAGAKVIQADAAARAPGSIGASILRKTTYRSPTAVTVSVGPAKRNVIARFVEYGTKPHDIPRRRKRKGRRKVLLFGGRFASRVHHPGTKPKPFLRPAYDQHKDDAQETMRVATKRVIRA